MIFKIVVRPIRINLASGILLRIPVFSSSAYTLVRKVED
jgi:hypothetical protein